MNPYLCTHLLIMRQVLFIPILLTALASCKTQEPVPAPSISIVKEMGYISSDTFAQIDSVVRFKVSAKSNHNILKQFALFVSTNGSAREEVDRSTILGIETATWETSHAVKGFVIDTLNYTIMAIDDNGKTSSISFKVNLKSITRSLSIDTSNQRVYNFYDSSRVSYDLARKTTLSQSESKDRKDLQDLTPKKDTFTSSWGSGHGNTRFIKVTSNVYSSATNTTYLENEWVKLSATATNNLTQIKNGDYYLVKTRQSGVKFDIYVIQITNVVNTLTDNMDYIEFSYKGG